MKSKSIDRIPSLRLHKPTGQAYVRLNGRMIYLGRHDKPDSRIRYNQMIAEWLANNRRLPVSPEEITVPELCAAYLKHAESYYVGPDGKPTKSLGTVKMAIRALLKFHRHTLAVNFGPNSLRAVRQSWIDRKLARKTVNDYTSEVKRLFKWGVSHEMVPPSVYHGLVTLEGLRAGRSGARETEAVKPVLESHIEAVKPFVSRQVRALLELQILIAARPGELLKLRAIDLDTSGRVWTATPTEHKTRYRGRERTLYFGPNTQAILKDFLADRPLCAYLFSPRDAEAERHDSAQTHRRSNQKRSPKKTERVVGEHYTTASYRMAIERACAKAGVPVWTPHRLRHNAATAIRKEYGLEAAQVMLGHSRADVTQVYAERNEELALRVARERG